MAYPSPREWHHEHFERYIPPVGGLQTELAIAGITGTVYYNPVIITEQMTIDRLGIVWGGVAAGNFYLAVYNAVAESPVNRLAVTVNTAVSGVNRRQQVAIAPATLQIDPGYYFFVNTHDNNTDTPYSNFGVFDILNPVGVADGPSWYEEAGAYAAPPAIATPAQSARPYMIWARVLSIP